MNRLTPPRQRVFNGTVVSHGQTDDQRVAAALAKAVGGVATLPAGTLYLQSPIALPSNITLLRGNPSRRTVIKRAGAATSPLLSIGGYTGSPFSPSQTANRRLLAVAASDGAATITLSGTTVLPKVPGWYHLINPAVATHAYDGTTQVLGWEYVYITATNVSGGNLVAAIGNPTPAYVGTAIANGIGNDFPLGSYLYLAAEAANVSIENIDFDGQFSGSYLSNLLLAVSVMGLQITGCNFKNHSSTGVRVQAIRGYDIVSCVFSQYQAGTNGYAISADGCRGGAVRLSDLQDHRHLQVVTSGSVDILWEDCTSTIPLVNGFPFDFGHTGGHKRLTMRRCGAGNANCDFQVGNPSWRGTVKDCLVVDCNFAEMDVHGNVDGLTIRTTSANNGMKLFRDSDGSGQDSVIGAVTLDACTIANGAQTAAIATAANGSLNGFGSLSLINGTSVTGSGAGIGARAMALRTNSAAALSIGSGSQVKAPSGSYAIEFGAGPGAWSVAGTGTTYQAQNYAIKAADVGSTGTINVTGSTLMTAAAVFLDPSTVWTVVAAT